MIFFVYRSANAQSVCQLFSHSLQRRHSGRLTLSLRRGFVTDNSKNLDGFRNIVLPNKTAKENSLENPTFPNQNIQLVYESPLGNVVSKLRTVSLMTAIIGMTGVPLMIALKGAIPEGGILAAAMLFVTGSVGSTAAIHFVFSPYVYRIEYLPIRQCSTKSSPGQRDCTSESSVTIQRDTLLKAWTRSLFLFDSSIVFDPCVDVQPYKGMRPMCNFLAKGRPLYVHPEFVYDIKLRMAMNLDARPLDPSKSPSQTNPDDDLF